MPSFRNDSVCTSFVGRCETSCVRAFYTREEDVLLREDYSSISKSYCTIADVALFGLCDDLTVVIA